MVSLGLSRIDFSRLRQPKISVRQIAFNAIGQVPFAESVLMMRMDLAIEIPSNVRCGARFDQVTARRLRYALEGVLQVEELPLDRVVAVYDGLKLQG